jgi:hypothetical protein
MSDLLDGKYLPCTESPCSESICSAISEICTARNVTTPDDKDKIEQSTKRVFFEEAVKEKLNIPSGYVKVAVLVLRWHPDIDDYAEEHTNEVSYPSIVPLNDLIAVIGLAKNISQCTISSPGVATPLRKVQYILLTAVDRDAQGSI